MNELQLNEAHKNYNDIVSLRKNINTSFWQLVTELKRCRENRYWAALGHESWASYLAQPEIDLNENTVTDYIYIFESISKAIKSSDMSDKMIPFDIDIGKLKAISPYIGPENASELLQKAKTLSRSDLREEIKLLKPPPEPLIPVEGKYQVIVIDPPWRYGTEYDGDSRRVASPYPEIPTWIKDKEPQDKSSLEEFNLPSDDNSILWLWTTHKFLPDAFLLMRHWGFEYKITFVWDKQRMGMGSWLRCQAEFCLLGARGYPRWHLTNERDLLSIARKEHSRKPDEFYEMVKRLSPNTKRIDIFSREKRGGFDQYGNETNKF